MEAGVLNGDCKGIARRDTYRVQTAVGKVMASIVCYSDGTLLVEFRAMCSDVKEVTTKFSQTAISINVPSSFLSYRPS